jgi:ABC-type uncharacterized transport system ATPase subunit
LNDITFDVCSYEILGIAGVDGNGQQELAEVITGMRHATGGHVRLFGEDVTNVDPHTLRSKGVGYIPAERVSVGTIGQFTVEDNLVLATYDSPPFSRFGLLDRKSTGEFADARIKQFDVRTPNRQTLAGALSGGNLQKVVLARELSGQPPVLICAQPTRGLDVGAIEYVHKQLLEQRARGAAILMISTELDEILMLSDRIAVIYQGKIMAIIQNENVDIERLGLLMAGTSEEHLEAAKA